MPVIDQISYFQNRRDEVPNQELAKRLAEQRDERGLSEIAAHLGDKNPNVQSDCLKVLYEVGYLTPELIAPYVEDFLKLVRARNNRLVWGAMIALASIAGLQPETCFAHLAELEEITEYGSVITQDNGIKTLAALAASKPEYRAAIFPFILDHLSRCGSAYLAHRAESVIAAVDEGNKAEFLAGLKQRLPDLSPAQAKRVEKLMRVLQK
jgi:hypothetical protein